jgi:hypothetical protein
MAADDLTAVIFRALYRDCRLLTIGGTHVVVPANTLILTGDSLGAIARQISELESPPELTELLLWEDPLPQRQK